MTYPCATCGKRVTYEDKLPTLYPFCSSRCQMVDLGRWLKGDFAITRALTPEECAGAAPPEPGGAAVNSE